MTIGKVGGRTYAFLGAERQGSVYAFDLDHRRGEASFAGYINTRPGDLGPEGASFVPAKDSPNGKPLLLMTNEITGTIAVIAVK